MAALDAAPQARSRWRPETFSWFVVAAGAVLQVWHFAGGRVLWLDEALLTLNLRMFSAGELMGKLAYDQVAPAGWLQVQDLLDGLIGRPEYELRIFSLLASLAALLVVRSLAFRVLGQLGALSAILMFAFLAQVVHYAAEVKPYAMDILFAAASLRVGVELLEPGARPWRAIAALAAVGVAQVLFAFSALFVLAAVGVVVFARRLSLGRWWEAAALAASGLVWLGLFAAFYFAAYHAQTAENVFMVGASHRYFEKTAYAPVPLSLADLRWYLAWTAMTTQYLFGGDSRVAGVLLGLVGGAAMIRRSPWTAAMVCGALPIAFIASSVEVYPLYKRLVLFLVPSAVLLIGAGIERLLERTPARLVIWAVLMILALSGSLVVLKREFSQSPPFAVQDIRPALKALARERRPGEAIYVSTRGVAAYSIYRAQYGLGDAPWTKGRHWERDWNCVLREAAGSSSAGRVWILLYGPRDPPSLNGVGPTLADWGLAGTAELRAARPGAYLYRLALRPLEGGRPAGPTAPTRCEIRQEERQVPPGTVRIEVG